MRYVAVVILTRSPRSRSAAQVPQPASVRPRQPTFEVASVKPNKTGAPGGSFVMPPGRFTATNIPLKVLITNAYQLSFFQVVGGPGWVSTDRFDIAAKAPDGAPPEQTRAMVRTLLKERFKLVVHMETQDTPIYALVQARADDGSLGPKLTRSTMDCGPIRAQRAAAHGRRRPRARRSGPAVPVSRGTRSRATSLLSDAVERARRRDALPRSGQHHHGDSGELPQDLRRVVEVVDRTGLTGEFDFELQFSAPPTTSARPIRRRSGRAVG